MKLGKPVELARIPVGDSAHDYILGVGACRKGECPVEVRYNGSTAKMQWLAPVGEAQPQSKTQWYLGDKQQPEAQTVLDAAAVPLTDDLNGVLVTLTSGFEHTHRQHSLFVATAKGLQKVWSLDEGSGPTSSTVRPTKQGELTSVVTFWSGDEQTADTYKATRLSWANAKGTLDALPASAMAIVSKPLSSVALARSAAAVDCLSKYLVLDSQSITGLGPGEAVLALPYDGSDRAAAAAQARACAPKLSFQPGVLDSKLRE